MAQQPTGLSIFQTLRKNMAVRDKFREKNSGRKISERQIQDGELTLELQTNSGRKSSGETKSELRNIRAID